MADVQGLADPRFERLCELLSATLDSGEDLGASVSVTLEGETVVDIWGGFADEDKATAWEKDTITNVWSTTKTMTSLAALVLVERGVLDVHAPVSSYWPEFAANGKDKIEIRHVMGHTSGVSGWDQPVEVDDLYDWDKSTSMLARQAPWWEPGTASGYHALNQGHLVGEVIRRITGRSLGRFFAEEVAGPLGVDFHIGLDPSEHHRVSNVVPPSSLIDVDASRPTSDWGRQAAAIDPESVMFKTITGPSTDDATVSWTPEWRHAEIGAANGHGNARSVARAQAVVANGGEFDGVRLLSPKSIDVIFEEQAHGVDLVLGEPVRFGIGYALTSEAAPNLPAGRICYWGGWGGSSVIVDLDRRMTFAYVMNRMINRVEGLQEDPRGDSLARATYEILS
jgi:CubicO group peptidase (beta-lactamase class C family)